MFMVQRGLAAAPDAAVSGPLVTTPGSPSEQPEGASPGEPSEPTACATAIASHSAKHAVKQSPPNTTGLESATLMSGRPHIPGVIGPHRWIARALPDIDPAEYYSGSQLSTCLTFDRIMSRSD